MSVVTTIKDWAGKLAAAAEWVTRQADKAKAAAAAASTFAAVAVAATADDALGLDETVTLLTAAIVFGAAVYAIVWRVPNKTDKE